MQSKPLPPIHRIQIGSSYTRYIRISYQASSHQSSAIGVWVSLFPSCLHKLHPLVFNNFPLLNFQLPTLLFAFRWVRVQKRHFFASAGFCLCCDAGLATYRFPTLRQGSFVSFCVRACVRVDGRMGNLVPLFFLLCQPPFFSPCFLGDAWAGEEERT